jgi:hypothetical protein
MGVGTGGEKGLEERGIDTVTPRLEPTLKQRLPSFLDAIFEARVLVSGGIGLEAGASVIVRANAKRIAHVVCGGHGGAVPRFQSN